MTWVRLEDSFGDHPKVIEAGELAGWLYVMGLCYCGRHLTDGFIPTAALTKLTCLPQRQQLAASLVRVGLWKKEPNGWTVHDYSRHQRLRADVEADRAAVTQRVRRYRERRNGVTSALVTDVKRNQIREDEITTPQTPQGGLVDNSGQYHPSGCGCSLCDFEGDELAKRRNA